ncbi:MAG: flavoprotein, partial [Candidatus Aerophobetes bacterium]|nr:flavoprotein [Candidatus Aerophobetes bacterium]
MSSALKNKNVLLGVTGSIAAYKAAEIVRLLREKGAVVYPIMTRASTHFVHPLTFQTLSSREVVLELFKEGEKKIRHISLAQLADILLIA